MIGKFVRIFILLVLFLSVNLFAAEDEEYEVSYMDFYYIVEKCIDELGINNENKCACAISRVLDSDNVYSFTDVYRDHDFIDNMIGEFSSNNCKDENKKELSESSRYYQVYVSIRYCKKNLHKSIESCVELVKTIPINEKLY